jgi:hypothetical protein
MSAPSPLSSLVGRRERSGKLDGVVAAQAERKRLEIDTNSDSSASSRNRRPRPTDEQREEWRRVQARAQIANACERHHDGGATTVKSILSGFAGDSEGTNAIVGPRDERNGVAAAHLAARNGNVECLRLIDQFADASESHFTDVERRRGIDVQTAAGWTPAMYAAQRGQAHSFRSAVLDMGADVTAAAKSNGQTAAHLAAAKSHCVPCLEMISNFLPPATAVKVLTAKDKFSRTPLDTAEGEAARVLPGLIARAQERQKQASEERSGGSSPSTAVRWNF